MKYYFEFYFYDSLPKKRAATFDTKEEAIAFIEENNITEVINVVAMAEDGKQSPPFDKLEKFKIDSLEGAKFNSELVTLGYAKFY